MRAWIEINKENLKFNIQKLKELSQNKKILCVVKANAYSLGAIEISKILTNLGVDFLGVANLNEAIELQDNDINANILILGVSFHEELLEADKRNLHITVDSMETLNFIKEHKLNLAIHLKVDTGMTRLGFDPEEIISAIEFCKKYGLNLKGIFSHFSDADVLTDESKAFTLQQINEFNKITKNFNLEYVHISNSAGITNFSEYINGNMVRVGIGMYGFTGSKKDPLLKNVFTVKTRVIKIKKVSKDCSVSYGRHYNLLAGETYAVLPLGYADGLKKYLSQNSYVLINDTKFEIIGNICMDMLMLKVPLEAIDKLKIGDEATVINSDIISDVKSNNLCVWELMTGLGHRLKRIFV